MTGSSSSNSADVAVSRSPSSSALSTTAPTAPVIPADYIRVLAEWLRLPVTTTSTALVYFYKYDKFRKSPLCATAYPDVRASLDPLLMAMTCVYLAAKTTDCSRKMRDVINSAHRALNPTGPGLAIDATYWRLRDSLLASELVLLRMLQFQFDVDLAYSHIVKFVLCVFDIESTTSTAWSMPTPDRRGTPEDVLAGVQAPVVPAMIPPSAAAVLQIAWGLISDSYLRSSCMQFKSIDLAMGALYIALMAVKCTPASGEITIAALCEAFQSCGVEMPNVEAAAVWMARTHAFNADKNQSGIAMGDAANSSHSTPPKKPSSVNSNSNSSGRPRADL